ncbi:MAG: LicD family protein [Paludibacteraceae bacterium]|nr:LicD family protein [Paludibacteraceae bacterium]
MPAYDIDTLHQHLLGHLKAIDDVCQKHGLRYYIYCGTMLGAVRHKGFIPWDDDLDIAMPRPDYERFIRHAGEWLPAPYEFVCWESNPEYPLPFGKIQNADTTLIERPHLYFLGGSYIDVFPIDGVPDGRWSQRIHFAKYEILKKIIYMAYRDPYRHGHGASCWLPLFCRKVIGQQRAQRATRRLLMKHDFSYRRSVCTYDDGMRGIIDKESVLGHPTPITFETLRVMGVQHADAYLTQMYGDYMRIPPHDDQRQHNFHYLDLEHPYRSYDGSRD